MTQIAKPREESLSCAQSTVKPTLNVPETEIVNDPPQSVFKPPISVLHLLTETGSGR